MPNILIRDLPDHVIAAIDANAQRLGLSRNEYLRRQLTSSVPPPVKVTVEDLARTARTYADVNDPEVMAKAWS
jgi:plasmid stability protein